MGGVTNSQNLRFPYLEEGIANTNVANLAADAATALDAQDVRRNLIIKRPLAVVGRLANQLVAVNTDTTVIWDTITTDPSSMVNLGTQPTRVTVPAAATGLWRVSFGGLFTTSWTRTVLTFMVSGVVKAQKSYWAQDITWALFSTMINVPNAGDYIEVRVRHAGGGTDPISFITMTASLAAKT